MPKVDQKSGRSKLGYRCNLRLVGQSDIEARGANTQLAWYKDCAYVSIIGTREFFPSTAHDAEGVAVIDASDSAAPELVRTLRTSVARNVQHEGLEVNQRRGMLVVQVGGISARYIEIYDVAKDCRDPVLVSRYDSGRSTFHGLRISDDGRTIYATDGIGFGTPDKPLHVIDVSDKSNPRLLVKWGPAEDGGPLYLIHDLDLSEDGTRAYLGASPLNTSLVGLGVVGGASESNIGPTVVTIDTTEIKKRAPNPDLKVVSQVDTPNFGHTVQRAVIGGKPYLIASGESPFATGLNCPWSWGHLIDMSNERDPRVVAQLKLAVNEAQNCASANADDVTYSIHYAGVDDPQRTKKVFYTYYGGGLRVFDVRDPEQPKEIAYYHPPPQPKTVLQPLIGTYGGDAQTPAWDSATSVVRYRPANGEIWFASLGGGFQSVTLTGRYACLPARAEVRGARLGVAGLGRTRARQRTALRSRPQANRTGNASGVDRYCTTDAQSLWVTYATASLTRSVPPNERRRVRGRAVVILSDSPLAAARGIRPGAKVGALRRRLHGERRLRVGDSVWYFVRGADANLVFKTRRSRVLAVGIADPRLTGAALDPRRL